MDKKQDEFLRELLLAFKIEAIEHYQAILNKLVELEKDPSDPAHRPLIETIFREIHSIKGAAMALNQHDLGRLCQGMENIFHKAKMGELTLTPLLFEALFQSAELLGVMSSEVDYKDKSFDNHVLSLMLKQLEMFTAELGSHETDDLPELPQMPFQREKQIVKERASRSSSAPGYKKNQTEPILEEFPDTIRSAKTDQFINQDTVRIATTKLRKLLYEAEGFISVKATLGYFIREIKKLKLSELSAISKEMEQFHYSLSRSIDDLLLDIKTTLLYPFSSVLDIIPKIVRDLGKEYNKEINLIIKGGEIEIDRRILEEINNPLIHLIRNCIDHGLETPKIRKLAKKPPAGILELRVGQDAGRHVMLTVRDDGAGIDREKVIQSAIKAGIISRETGDRMTDDDVFMLIFKSGISTSPFITDISGRGLGMAIVAEKVSKLGGSITVVSNPGQGTAFTIKLPVTISNFRGILVEVDYQFFIIPTMSVGKALKMSKKEIRILHSKHFILLGDESISLVRLNEILGIPVKKSKKKEEISILIITLGQDKLAISVDNVYGEQEVTVRDMGPVLVHVRNFSGVAILGNGQVVPIVHIPDLIDSANRITTSNTTAQGHEADEFLEKKQKYILVAEDSITMRSLLRNIIEAAGYLVKTAVDGLEAFQFIKKEIFDLVVTDIEMPRMNGLELTHQIRNDDELSAIPVILVTALDSPDERKRGMQSGANAYLVKGSFEQSNLIEMIQRLI